MRQPAPARSIAVVLFVILLTIGPADARAQPPARCGDRSCGRVAVTVTDPHGAPVPMAVVALMTAQESQIGVAASDEAGLARLADVPAGTYELTVRALGFAVRRLAVRVAPGDDTRLTVTLSVEALAEEITVTAERGGVTRAGASSQAVTVIGERELAERTPAVVAQAAVGKPGLALQRTSPTIAGIYVRGLTGGKVNVYVDGVRYSTAAARGGINTFMDLVNPAFLEGLEVVRGPSSAQYGSDALGGSVHFLTRLPALGVTGARRTSGLVSVAGTSADLGGGGDLVVGHGGSRVGIIATVTGRRLSTLRPGEGRDSHAAVTRFFGLPSTAFTGTRLPDTAFTQYGGLVKLQWVPGTRTQVSAHYARSQQDGGKRHDQLLGGDGNLVADLRNLMLDFFYVRASRLGVAGFDEVTATLSANLQREERVNQGGNGNPRAPIAHEYERTTAYGVQASASRSIGTRHRLLVGGDLYPERIDAPSFAFDPTTGTTAPRRPRVPDDARYWSAGLFVQETFDAVPDRVRVTGSLRWSHASYTARAASSPLVNGQPLWPDDELRASALAFRAGATVAASERLMFVGSVSRGFRAPHVTDLGTLGLTGSGFEVAAPDIAGLDGTVGSSAAASAVSTGRPVEQVRPETSFSVDGGLRYRTARVRADVTVFTSTIAETIERRALTLPPGAVGTVIGGQPIVAQSPTGTVFVPVATNPVLARANIDDVRSVGIEAQLEWRPASAWTLTAAATAIRAENPATGAPPDVEGGTPAPDVMVRLRYAPSPRWWIEPSVLAASRQSRLSSLDLEDRRTGAMRSRASIQRFFANGATARGWVGPGPDGILGSADDVLLATGERVVALQDRVLGPDVVAAPLRESVAGYTLLALAGGIRFGSRYDVGVAFENLTDRNYRGISWGIDGAGRGVIVRFRAEF